MFKQFFAIFEIDYHDEIKLILVIIILFHSKDALGWLQMLKDKSD